MSLQPLVETAWTEVRIKVKIITYIWNKTIKKKFLTARDLKTNLRILNFAKRIREF